MKFHNCIFGRNLELDHRPLMFLFDEKNDVPRMASSRIVRWALTLSTYNYTIYYYKPGHNISHADALSRLPRPTMPTGSVIPADLVALVEHLSSTSVSAGHIKLWTASDPVLSCIQRFIESGWPEEGLSQEYQPYLSQKSELSTLDGWILRGARVIIPLHSMSTMSYMRHTLALAK